jgi:nucleotide-binding universal stress UspA family protein
MRGAEAIMFKHILVPLDGSSFGEAALRPAFALAQRNTTTQITLLSVQDLWTGTASELPYEEREAYLNKLARAHSGAAVRCVVRCGHATDQILEEAESSGVDLIVMSTHGRGGVSRVWLGSVADQCLRHSAVPLLLVRPQPSERQSAGAAFAPHRVVVPLDGTLGAEMALRRAKSLAHSYGAPVALIRAVEERGPNGRGERVAEARSYLERIAMRLRAQGLTVTTQVTVGVHAAEAILGAAAGELIVMRTHARAPLARALLGSVADKVVRGARGVVLLIPPGGAEQIHALRGDGDEPAGLAL